MANKRDAKLTLNFTIEDGVVHFDVEHGDEDGKNCEALASVFLQGAGEWELSYKNDWTETRKTSRLLS